MEHKKTKTIKKIFKENKKLLPTYYSPRVSTELVFVKNTTAKEFAILSTLLRSFKEGNLDKKHKVDRNKLVNEIPIKFRNEKELLFAVGSAVGQTAYWIKDRKDNNTLEFKTILKNVKTRFYGEAPDLIKNPTAPVPKIKQFEFELDEYFKPMFEMLKSYLSVQELYSLKSFYAQQLLILLLRSRNTKQKCTQLFDYDFVLEKLQVPQTHQEFRRFKTNIFNRYCIPYLEKMFKGLKIKKYDEMENELSDLKHGKSPVKYVRFVWDKYINLSCEKDEQKSDLVQNKIEKGEVCVKNPQDINGEKKKIKTSEKIKALEEIENQFNEFWKLYPNKLNKKKGKEQFIKQIKNGVDFSEILKGLKKYVSYCNVAKAWYHPKFAQGWLSAGRWADDYDDLIKIEMNKNPNIDISEINTDKDILLNLLKSERFFIQDIEEDLSKEIATCYKQNRLNGFSMYQSLTDIQNLNSTQIETIKYNFFYRINNMDKKASMAKSEIVKNFIEHVPSIKQIKEIKNG